MTQKQESFETEVINTATGEEEFIDQIIEVAKQRFQGLLDDKALVRAIDAIHESAHVSTEQRWSEPDQMSDREASA